MQMPGSFHQHFAAFFQVDTKMICAAVAMANLSIGIIGTASFFVLCFLPLLSSDNALNDKVRISDYGLDLLFRLALFSSLR